jgi:hypothetical protein
MIFEATDSYQLRGHTVFVGPSPFEFTHDDGFDRFKLELWTIHGKRYRVIGVESYGIPIIRKGIPIGLMVEEEA